MSYCVFETWKQFSAGIFHVPSHLNKKVVDLLKKTLTVDPLKRATVKDIRCSHFVFGPRIYWSVGLVVHVSNFLGSMNGSKLTCPSICFHPTARWTHLWSTRRSYVKCARCVQAVYAVLICTTQWHLQFMTCCRSATWLRRTCNTLCWAATLKIRSPSPTISSSTTSAFMTKVNKSKHDHILSHWMMRVCHVVIHLLLTLSENVTSCISANRTAIRDFFLASSPPPESFLVVQILIFSKVTFIVPF